MFASYNELLHYSDKEKICNLYINVDSFLLLAIYLLLLFYYHLNDDFSLWKLCFNFKHVDILKNIIQKNNKLVLFNILHIKINNCYKNNILKLTKFYHSLYRVVNIPVNQKFENLGFYL